MTDITSVLTFVEPQLLWQELIEYHRPFGRELGIIYGFETEKQKDRYPLYHL